MQAQLLLAAPPLDAPLTEIKTDLLAVTEGLRESGFGGIKILVSGQHGTVTVARLGERTVVWWPRSNYDSLKAAWQAVGQAQLLFTPFPLDPAVNAGQLVIASNDSAAYGIVDRAIASAPSVTGVLTVAKKFVYQVEGEPVAEVAARWLKRVAVISAIGGTVYFAHHQGWLRQGAALVKTKLR